MPANSKPNWGKRILLGVEFYLQHQRLSRLLHNRCLPPSSTICSPTPISLSYRHLEYVGSDALRIKLLLLQYCKGSNSTPVKAYE
jgi:hypothetical protein